MVSLRGGARRGVLAAPPALRPRLGRRTRSAVWLCLAARVVVGQVPEAARAAPASGRGLHCDSEAAAALTDRARSLVADPLAAANHFERAYRSCPSRSALLLEASRVLSDSRHFDAAIEMAGRFLALAPASLPGLVLKANAEFMAQRFEEAKVTARSALEIDPDSADALKLLGNACYLLGDAARAESVLLRLLDRHPDDSGGAYMLGRIYYQENRFSLAAAQFQRVLGLEPASYKAYDNLALCYEALGETERAVRHYLAAIQLVETAHPGYDWPYANLANLLIDRGDLQQGFDAASTAAKRNPSRARNFYLAGKALAKQGRRKEALEWLERSAGLDPGYPEPLYWLGQVRTRLGDREGARRALAAFRAAKADEPDETR